MKDKKKRNPLRDYLDRKCIVPLHFAKECSIHPNTMYAYLNHHRKPGRHFANVICAKSNGEITLEDFGYD